MRGIKPGAVFNKTGWAYFTSQPVPERLKTVELRTVLGTGKQDYLPCQKSEVRNPECEVTFKIRVPKERVMIKTKEYIIQSDNKEERISVKKYAIAGGISFDDVMKDYLPHGGRYLNKGLPKWQAQKKNW